MCVTMCVRPIPRVCTACVRDGEDTIKIKKTHSRSLSLSLSLSLALSLSLLHPPIPPILVCLLLTFSPRQPSSPTLPLSHSPHPPFSALQDRLLSLFHFARFAPSCLHLRPPPTLDTFLLCSISTRPCLFVIYPFFHSSFIHSFPSRITQLRLLH